jgi:hypothetical protein
MKHGDQAKKSAKAVQASGKKSSSKEAVAKTSKESDGGKAKTSGKEAGPKAGAQKAGGKNVKNAGVEAATKTATKAPAKTAAKAPGKDAVKAGSGGNGKTKVADPGGPSFANAVVGAAFKRAVKKYSNAFRRLTD